MNALAALNQWAAAGLAAFLNTLWYAAAVVALTWLGLRCWKQVNAATRHWIWTAVLAFLLALPFLSGLVARSSAAAPATASVAALAPAVEHVAPLMLTVDASAPGPNYWPLVVLAIWLAAAGWQLAGIFRGLLAVRGLKARAQALPRATLPLPMRRRVQLLSTPEARSPMAVGFAHPAVIAPPDLWAPNQGDDEGERRDLLLHELAHLARYDDWTLLGTRVIAAVLALHPLAAFVRGRTEREREMAADDCVVARTGAAQGGAYNDAARRYARSLARMHDRRRGGDAPLLAAGIAGPRSALGERIASLVSQGRRFSARPSLARLALGGATLALLLALGGFLPGWIAIAQTAVGPSSFYAASIKLGNREAGHHSHINTSTGGRFRADSPLKDLIEFAYDIKDPQLEGLPAWASSRNYAIQAVPPPDTPVLHGRPEAEMVQRMLRALLADRFGLRTHFTTKQLPVYYLVVAKGGPKLKPTAAADYIAAGYKPKSGPSVDSDGDSRGVRMHALGVSTALLAQHLTTIVGRPVIDQTGLTGTYVFTLNWSPLLGRGGGGDFGPSSGQPAAGDFSGPSIFTAVQQQLGLRLKSGKGPVAVLVVDHVAPPTPD